jgi:hypothetical protein
MAVEDDRARRRRIRRRLRGGRGLRQPGDRRAVSIPPLPSPPPPSFSKLRRRNFQTRRTQVIAKGHSSHPRTTQLLVEECAAAASETGMPKAMIQLIYRTSHEDGYKLVRGSV